jgi:hypothetical protein
VKPWPCGQVVFVDRAIDPRGWAGCNLDYEHPGSHRVVSPPPASQPAGGGWYFMPAGLWTALTATRHA